MNREGKKCVLYPRVSTEMQVDGYSLEGQKNGLKRFADREEMEIVGIYEDAGKSGKSIEGRPAFKKMLSDIKNGLEIDYILVYKLSRFGRNAADILNSLEFVQSYGINLICIEEGIDSSQTSGKLLISVLSAVAEIERENIIEQTMNGRREKARQGGWNGGFAPYGYYLKDNQLLIEETEAEAIRIIFDKFANSDIGLGGVAKYLNLQGIKKIPRQNGTLETWSSHFIRLILDNPVYCGKIAYGRRTREKVKGTKNEYKQVHAEDYILEDGQHEGIISEELWQKVHAKRMATGIKQPSKIGKDRSHLLTGILKCPLCGSSMYTNKHAWTNKDGTYKEVYYYICGRNKQERGHHCDYKASLRKTDIEPLVIEAVKELVSDKYFAKEIEKRIGVQIDTTAIDKELANYESKLKEVDLNKARLEREIDNLPIDARFRERKIHDMTLRLDGLYDTIVELEERIEDAKLRRSSIEMEAITLDNIYKLMLNFGKLYDIISDEEKKSLITYLIKEIQIYPNGESEQPLKSIEFNFPIYRDGQEVRRLLWEKGNTVETCAVRQLAILSSAAQCVREGGILVYSTCTFSTEENEGVVQKFLESHPEFVLEKPNVTFGRPAYGVDAVRIFPMDGGEGHFAARFRRVAPCEERFAPFSFKPDRETQAHAEELYTSLFTDVPGRFQRVRDRVILLPNELPDIAGLSVLRAGVEFGEAKKNRIEPAHGIFMASRAENCRSVLHLTSNDPALFAFLRGEEIPAEGLSGYTAVAADGIVTGFGKASNGVLKNRYPKGLRTHL
ncbi:MAG: RsmF rRNA methyltransferase first C-terminal domain-containing protein [Clostridia bacterium]